MAYVPYITLSLVAWLTITVYSHVSFSIFYRVLFYDVKQMNNTGMSYITSSSNFKVLICNHPTDVAFILDVHCQMSRHTTKPTNDLCAQRRHNSAWASAQSGQSRAVLTKKALVPRYPLSAQRRLWSDCKDAQAELSFRGAQMSFCWFCHNAAQILFAIIGWLNMSIFYWDLDSIKSLVMFSCSPTFV